MVAPWGCWAAPAKPVGPASWGTPHIRLHSCQSAVPPAMAGSSQWPRLLASTPCCPPLHRGTRCRAARRAIRPKATAQAQRRGALPWRCPSAEPAAGAAAPSQLLQDAAQPPVGCASRCARVREQDSLTFAFPPFAASRNCGFCKAALPRDVHHATATVRGRLTCSPAPPDARSCAAAPSSGGSWCRGGNCRGCERVCYSVPPMCPKGLLCC